MASRFVYPCGCAECGDTRYPCKAHLSTPTTSLDVSANTRAALLDEVIQVVVSQCLYSPYGGDMVYDDKGCWINRTPLLALLQKMKEK